MGTDIHAVMQAKVDGKWVDIETEYDEKRHYMLFAWLGDVRNGYGFAGVPTHDPLTPIAAGRGLPDDFEVDEEINHPLADKKFLSKWRQEMLEKYPDDYPNGPSRWMGDHSHSWVTADEVIDGAKHLPKIMKTGVVTRGQFEAWDGKSEPQAYCGWTSGNGILVSDMTDIKPETTHVQIRWFQKVATELDYFIKEMRRLKKKHGEVRMVFGFDS